MLHAAVSLLAAVIPRLSWPQYRFLVDHFQAQGLQSAPAAALLKKFPAEVPNLPAVQENLERLTSYLLREEVHHVHPAHPLYPRSLLQLERPPLFLLLRGDLSVLGVRGLSVVGARRFSEDSARWMRAELKPFLKKWQVATISGGAYGVDQEAHRLGLYHGGGTLVVLPSGLSAIYPKNLSLQGPNVLLMSEWLPWEVVRPYYFKYRNRIIAALSRGLVVIEAAEKSGTMLTAQWAADLGRDIAVVPGTPMMSSYGGSLRLIQEGAHLIRDQEDLGFWWEGL